MGCCGVTYEEEVENEIVNYLKTLKNTDNAKKRLLKEIKDDLSRRALTVDKYYYPYRIEDVEKTVNFYKNYISIRLKGFVEFYERKKKDTKPEEKEKEEQDKNTEKNENKDNKEKKSESDKESEIEKDENKEEIAIKRKDPTKLNNNNITIPDISNQTQSLKSKGDNYTFEKPKDDNNIESELTNKKEEEINNKTNEKENENNNNLSEDQVRIKEEET